MPERLAGDIGALFAGALFAWALGALLRLAFGATARGARAGNDGAAKPRCGRRPKRGGAGERRVRARSSVRGRMVAFAWLSVAPLALIAAGAASGTQAARAVSTVAAGTLFGAWLATRPHARLPRPRRVAAIGGATGALALAGGFALQLLAPRELAWERGALYVVVSLGAWMVAASAGAWRAGGVRDSGGRTARAAFDDRTMHGLALALFVALAYAFVAADPSAQFPQLRLDALFAASGLALALGMRAMTGEGGARVATLPHATTTAARTVDPQRLVARASLAGIPEEWLVAACGGETFDPACIARFARDGFAHSGARPPASPRRRRDRADRPVRPAAKPRWIGNR